MGLKLRRERLKLGVISMWFAAKSLKWIRPRRSEGWGERWGKGRMQLEANISGERKEKGSSVRGGGITTPGWIQSKWIEIRKNWARASQYVVTRDLKQHSQSLSPQLTEITQGAYIFSFIIIFYSYVLWVLWRHMPGHHLNDWMSYSSKS